MAKLRRRVLLLKRIKIRKSRYRLVSKAKTPVANSPVSVGKPQVRVQKAAENVQVKQQQQPSDNDALATEMTLPPQPNTGPVASFKPELNPYAYMLSQLPHMLDSIPDLVTTTGQLDDTEQSDNQSSGNANNRSTLENPQTQCSERSADDQMVEKSIVDEPVGQVSCSAQENDVSHLNNSIFYNFNNIVELKVGNNFRQFEQVFSELSDNGQTQSQAVSIDETVQSPLSEFPQKQQVEYESDVAQLPRLDYSLPKANVCWAKNVIDDNPLSRFLSLSQRSANDFPWPGLPEQSCRLVRYGGNGERQRVSHLKETQVPKSLIQRFEQIAQSLDLSLTEAFLLSGGSGTFATMLAQSSIKDVMTSKHVDSQISFAALTVDEYLNGLLAGEKVCVSESWPQFFYPKCTVLQQINEHLSELPAVLRKLATSSEHLFISIKNQQFNVFVEIVFGCVLIYADGTDAQCYRINDYLRQLDGRAFPQSAERLNITVYQVPTDIDKQLAQSLEFAMGHWMSWREQPWLQFVASSLTDIGSAELKDSRDN